MGIRFFALVVVLAVGGSASATIAALLPNYNQALPKPYIYAAPSAEAQRSRPASIGGVIDSLRLAFQNEKENAILLPSHVRIGEDGKSILAVSSAPVVDVGQPSAKRGRIPFFDPSIKSPVEERDRSGADKSENPLATEYLSQPLQGTERRDTEVIRRAEKEGSEAMQIMYAQNTTIDGVHNSLETRTNTTTKLEPLPHPDESAGALARSQDPPLISSTIEDKSGPPTNDEVSTKTKQSSPIPTQEGSQSSGLKISNAWGALGSAVNSLVGKVTGSQSEGDNLTSESFPDSTRNGEPQTKTTDAEIRAVVDEIIAQVQMRSADEFKEHKEFLEREKILDANGRLAVRPLFNFVQRVVPVVLASAGWSQKEQRAILDETRARLLQLAGTNPSV